MQVLVAQHPVDGFVQQSRASWLPEGSKPDFAQQPTPPGLAASCVAKVGFDPAQQLTVVDLQHPSVSVDTRYLPLQDGRQLFGALTAGEQLLPPGPGAVLLE